MGRDSDVVGYKRVSLELGRIVQSDKVSSKKPTFDPTIDPNV
jgi:hypothetical protein